MTYMLAVLGAFGDFFAFWWPVILSMACGIVAVFQIVLWVASRRVRAAIKPIIAPGADGNRDAATVAIAAAQSRLDGQRSEGSTHATIGVGLLALNAALAGAIIVAGIALVPPELANATSRPHAPAASLTPATSVGRWWLVLFGFAVAGLLAARPLWHGGWDDRPDPQKVYANNQGDFYEAMLDLQHEAWIENWKKLTIEDTWLTASFVCTVVASIIAVAFLVWTSGSVRVVRAPSPEPTPTCLRLCQTAPPHLCTCGGGPLPRPPASSPTSPRQVDIVRHQW